MATTLTKTCLSDFLCGAEIEVEVSTEDSDTERTAYCANCDHVSRWSSTFHPDFGGWQLEPVLDVEDLC